MCNTIAIFRDKENKQLLEKARGEIVKIVNIYFSLSCHFANANCEIASRFKRIARVIRCCFELRDPFANAYIRLQMLHQEYLYLLKTEHIDLHIEQKREKSKV